MQLNNNTCKVCNIACTSCSSNTNTSCKNCSLGYYLNINTTICDTVCPAGQYIDSNIPYLCVVCGTGCKTCLTTSTYCTSCLPTYYLSYNQTSCSKTCPNG